MQAWANLNMTRLLLFQKVECNWRSNFQGGSRKWDLLFVSCLRISLYRNWKKIANTRNEVVFSRRVPGERWKGSGCQNIFLGNKIPFLLGQKNSSCTADLLSLPSMSEPYFTLKIQLHWQVIKGKRLFCRCFCKWKYFEDLMRLLFSLTYSL